MAKRFYSLNITLSGFCSKFETDRQNSGIRLISVCSLSQREDLLVFLFAQALWTGRWCPRLAREKVFLAQKSAEDLSTQALVHTCVL